jgi:hypothetical protein
MRHKNLVDAVTALGLLGTVTFTGCGGGGSGSGGGGNNNPPPTISSFTASPATVTDGSSAMLTAVFNNGTGSITPGNISATSGTAVSVTPPNDTTTTYTLTATSGTAVPVSPTSTTTYTLTVTNAAGTAVTQTATVTVQAAPTAVTVDPASPGIAVTNQMLGMNAAAWYDQVDNASAISTAFGAAGIKGLRWPGGSWSTRIIGDIRPCMTAPHLINPTCAYKRST